jgi:hypothetical protein
MDAARFDILTQSIAAAASRRRVLAATPSLLLGSLGVLELKQTHAHNKRKQCKGKEGKQKKKCLKKAKQHYRQHASGDQLGTQCRDDGDCPNVTESCKGGRCLPVCPEGSCPVVCNFGCVIQLTADGGRLAVCASTLIVGVPPDLCTTDADCLPGPRVCILDQPTENCATSPCGICVSVNSCEV